jgi:hypothetical protein
MKEVVNKNNEGVGFKVIAQRIQLWLNIVIVIYYLLNLYINIQITENMSHIVVYLRYLKNVWKAEHTINNMIYER